MKNFVYHISIILLFTVATGARAQNQGGSGVESIVNDQFGTLLESFLVDGKIEEAEARSYIETVFGNDPELQSYLQAIDISKQILAAGKAPKMSLNDNVMALNSSLLSIIPDSYKKNLLQNPHYLGWQLGQEMNNGGITAETLQNTVNFLAEGIKKNQQDKLIVEKLKLITPRAEVLRKVTSPAKTVINNSSNTANWKLNPIKITKGFFSDASTFNKVTIEEGNVVLDPTEGYADKFLNVYKNKEKFDFSKDFKLTIKGKLDPYTYAKVDYQSANFSVLIGQYYMFDAYLMYTPKFEDMVNVASFSVKVPDPEFTTTYGVYNFESLLFFTKNPKVKTVTSHLNKAYAKTGALGNDALNFNTGFEFVIQSKDGYITCLVNGIDTGIKKPLTYFPNKYSFDIKAAIDRKTTIESMVLEHL